MADGSLIFDTQIDSTGISRFARTAENNFGSLLKANVIGELVARGFEKAAQATFDFAKSSITLASDLTEVQNVVDVTFGDNAGVIDEWAKSAGENFGIAELQAKKFNGVMGAMLKSSGIASDEITGMSTNLSGLAGDMASFNNLDTQEAFDKIRAGISGETEPLKQLGINMSVANLEAFAMSEGINKAYSEMSQAEQVTLRYNYLLAQTADQQGDYLATSDGLANQLRNVKNNISDVAATIGTDLLPMVTDTVTEINGMIQQLGTAYETGGIDGLTSAVGDVLGDVVAEITEIVPDVVNAGLTVVESLVESLGDNADIITQAVTDIAVSLTSGLTGMLPELLQAVLSIARGIIDSLGEAMPDLIPKVINDVLDVIMTALSNIDGMIDAGLALIQGLTDGLINSIPVIVDRLPEIITAILDGVISAASKLVIGGAEIMQNINQGMIDEVGNGAQFENIGWTIQKAILKGIWQGLENFGGDLYEYFYNNSDEGKAAEAAQATAEKALEEAQAKLKAKTDYMQEQSDKAMGIAKTAIAQVNSIFGSVGNGLTSIGEQATEAITTNTENLKTAWEQINHDYATGVISSEEELYAKRLETWQLYGDESNKDHWNYFEDLKGMEQNFAADSIKQAEETAKKQQEEQEKLTAEIKKEKQKQLDIIKDNFKKQLDIAKDSINQTITAYKSQFDTINGYADDYKSKLLDVGDVFTVTTETDEQGNQKTTYAVENMEKQIKAMEEYNADIKRLKEQGASQALLSEVTEMGFEEGSNFANYLENMSDEEFAEINKLYNQREQAAAELSQGLYADELESIKNGFFAELETDLNAMPEIAKQAGADSVKAFIDGISAIDENSFESISKYFESYTDTAQTAIEGINLDEAVKTSLSEADMSALGLTAGQQFTEGFNQAMADLSLKMTAGVQAERASTATAITGVNPTSTATTLSPQTIRLESTLNANVFVDGEKMAKVVTKYQQQTNRQRGQ